MPATRPSPELLRRLELVVQHTTNMVVVTNRAREVEWVNPAYSRVTGWTLAEVRGRNPRSFLHGPRTSLAAASRLGGMLRRGEAVNDFEMLNYKKSGEPYWVSLSIQPVVDGNGHVTEYISIQTDITERKRAQLEQAQSFRRLAEAQRIAKLGTTEHDLASGRVRCAGEVCRMLGLPAGPSDIAYEDLLLHVHQDDRAAMRSAYESAIDDGEPFAAEFRVLDALGELRWVAARGVLERSEDGRPTAFRMAVQDITERKATEQLRQAKAVLERSAAVQMESLARVSHELRTPLHAVLGFADMLERQEAPHWSERSRMQLRHIREASRHLLLIVNDIVDLTRLHQGHGVLERQPVPLAPLVDAVLAMVQPLAADSGVQLRHGGPQNLSVVADRQRLAQVLINLAGNAVKYNRPGGWVEITAAPAGAGRVALAVRDNGRGIAEADLSRVFEPFFRAGPVDDGAPQPAGSGLGLAIARSLVRGMGGEIHVGSRPGQGSSFIVELPEAEPTGAAAGELPAPRTAAAPASERRARVLYIEDNEVNCLLIESYLAERPGIRVECVGRGEAGLALARRLRPALILVDMNLPDMDGLGVMRRVLADPVLYRIPCVAFSADAEDADVEAAIRAGFREYLRKPIGAADFLATIDHLLDEEPQTTRL